MTPYIQALIAMTGDKLQQRMQKDPTAASDSLLFMGNQHDTVPRRLLQDPLLSPRDKIRLAGDPNAGAGQRRRGVPLLQRIAGAALEPPAG